MTRTSHPVRVAEALARGESDARLLDGRDFDANYWRSARRSLSVLLRRMAIAERERDAYRAVLEETEARRGGGTSVKQRLIAAIDKEYARLCESKAPNRYELARLKYALERLRARGSGPLPRDLRAMAEIRYGIRAETEQAE